MRSTAYFFLLLALAGTALAQTCASPILKTATGSFSISSCNQADVTGTPGIVKKPCYIKFTPTTSSYYRIRTTSWNKKSGLFNAFDDSAIRIDKNCPFSTPVIDGYHDNKNAADKKADVTVAMTAGQSYYIAVGSGSDVSSASNGGGTVSIEITDSKYGRCDDFILSADEGNNDVVPKNADAPVNNGIYHGVYMKFTPSTTGTYIITVASWSALVASLAVYSGACGSQSLNLIAKDAPTGSVSQFYPEIELTLQGGTQYIIHAGNAFDLLGFPPAADSGRIKIVKPIGRCESAYTWTEPGPQKVDAAFAYAATKDSIYKPVWGKFTTGAAGDVIFDVQNWDQLGGPRIKVYRGNACNSLTEITSHTDGTRVSAELTASETVYVVIGNTNDIAGAGEGNLSIKRPVGRCTSPVTLDLGNQTVNAEPAFAPTKDGTYKPVWGKYTHSGASEDIVFETTSWSALLSDSEIRVYTGTPTGTACNGLTQVATNNNIATLNTLSRTEFRLNNGDSVYVMIGNPGNIAGYGSGNLMVRKIVGRCLSAVPAVVGAGGNNVDAYLALAPTILGLYKPVWSKFTPGAGKAGTYSIDVTSWSNGALGDSKLAIFRNSNGFTCASPGAAAASNDNKEAGVLTSRVEIDVDATEEIFIVIGNANSIPGYATGTFTITKLEGRCNSPVTATAETVFNSLTLPLGLPAPLTVGSDTIYLATWFKYTAASAGVHVFYVTAWSNSGDNDAEMFVLQGDNTKRDLADLTWCTNPTKLGHGNDVVHPVSKLPRVEVTLTVGQEVLVVVGNANENAASTARADTPNQHGSGTFKVQFVDAGRCDVNPYALTKDVPKSADSEDVFAPHFSFDGKNIWSPVWFTFTADAVARYAVNTSSFTNGGDNDPSIAIVYGADCNNLELLAFNDDRHEQTKLAKTSAYLGAGDKVYVVVGNTAADSAQWTGDVLLVVSTVAHFGITVEKDVDEDELEKGFNMLMDLPEETNMITSDYSTPGDNGKRKPNKPWKPIPKPAIETHDLEFMFVGEYDSDEFISKLAKILAERTGKFYSLGFLAGPLLCKSTCAGYDIDMDEIDDAADNCPGVYDPAGRNSDANELGDVCQCLVNNVMVEDGKENQCLRLGHISQEGNYKGQIKYAGDYTFLRTNKKNTVDFVPGDYTPDGQWLDCNCKTWELPPP